MTVTPKATVHCTAEISCSDIISLINDYKKVELGEGTFYTAGYPDNYYNNPIIVGDESVIITGNGTSVIKRPDNSLGTTTQKDFRHGLYFVPENASQAEIDSAVWTISGEGIEYTTIIRGTLRIENLVLDCNMANQGIVEGDKVEHSGMIRFNGRVQEYQGKKIILAFEKVTIRNVHMINGGWADNIYIGRSYSKPNIELCEFINLTEGERVAPKRGSIVASSTAKKIVITNCDLYKIELEESNLENWDLAPGHDIPGEWFISNSTFDKMDIAHKGYKVNVYGYYVDVTHSAFFYQVGGLMESCTLNIQDNLIRMNRLRGMDFIGCSFKIHPEEGTGNIRGIKPFGQYGQSCDVTFIGCDFAAVADMPTGSLITSEYSVNDEVNVSITDCTFDPRTDYIIQVYERGNWFVGGVHESDLDRIIIKDKPDIVANACVSLN